jgi:uncharacterized membrane protein
VGGLSDLLGAVSVLVPALGSTFVLVWTSVRKDRRPREVAKSAAEEAAAAVLAALADGDLSEEDVHAIQRALRRGGAT